jgi:hypothetical protein
MLRVTGGNVVAEGSDTTSGHFEQIPIEEAEGAGGYIGGVITTAPSVVIADGSLSNVGPRTGIGLTITVDGTSWEITNIIPVDADGATYRLMLKTPD